jgi:hypothetical protein
VVDAMMRRRRWFSWRDRPIEWTIDSWMHVFVVWILRLIVVLGSMLAIALPWQAASHTHKGVQACDWRCDKRGAL